MARRDYPADTSSPDGTDRQGWRHWGDSIAGRFVASRLQALDVDGLSYNDLQMTSDGRLLVSSDAAAGGSSGGLTDAQLRAAPVVTTGPLTDAQLRAAGVPVTLAVVPLPAGASTETTLVAVSTGLGADGATPPAITGTGVRGWLRAIYEKLAATLSVSVTNFPASQAVTLAAQPLPAGASTEATLAAVNTKLAGTLVVKAVRDTARTRVSIIADNVAAVTAEALFSLVKVKDGVAAAAATTIPVTAGKTLNLESITLSVRTTTAANPWAIFRIRINPAGSAVVTSPVEFVVEVGGTAAVIGNTAQITVPLPDGFELSGTHQLAVTHIGNLTTNLEAVTLSGYEY